MSLESRIEKLENSHGLHPGLALQTFSREEGETPEQLQARIDAWSHDNAHCIQRLAVVIRKFSRGDA